MPPSGSEPPSGPLSSAAPTRRMADRMEVGSKLGRYTIEGAIGEGGMGVVYRARDARLGRKVALKVLFANPDDPESVERTKRFLREARSAAAIDHPNAVAIFDVGEEAEASFMAMELVNGQSLRAFVGAGEPDVATRLRWLSDVASALSAAHRARVIHRDIKPENVMIRDDGRVKVLDFGLARRAAGPSSARAQETASAESAPSTGVPRMNVDPAIDGTFTETGQTTLTSVGVLLGTPQYMAPEQIRSAALDGRSDQFSWGIMAYELLTGEPPWPGAGLGVMARILASEPRPIGEINPAVPEAAAAVVMQALEKEPEARFPSMADVIAALEPYAEPSSRSDPRSIRPRSLTPGSVPTLRPPTVEHKTQRSPDFVAPAVPVTMGTTPPNPGTPLPPKPRAPRPPPKVEVVDAPPEPIQARGLVFAVAGIALLLGGILGWKAFRARAQRVSDPAFAASAAPLSSASAGSAGSLGALRAPGGAAPRATAVTELPEPRSQSPDALAAYRAGLAAMRFGGIRGTLERAAALDPSLAVAHLQCAADATEYAFDEAGRAHLRRATELRAQLDERDQMLLDALEPVLLRQPADWKEGGRRLGLAVERFPGDAQLWYQRGLFAQASEGPAASEPFVAHAIELDPKYAEAMSLLGQDLLYLGRTADAREILRRGLSVAPAYTSCGVELANLYEHEGACEEEEALARQLVAASTAQDIAQGMLARALAARGRPEAAVREALKLKWAALTGADRAPQEAADALALDLYAGDFASAETRARALEAAAVASSREADHGLPARILAQIYAETGRAADAAHIAEAYRARREGWEPDERAEDYAMAADATPELLAVARWAGKLPHAELAAKRAEWVRAWERRAAPYFRRYLWPHAFAATVETADDAREALAALPAYEPLPAYSPRTLVEAAIGRTFLLAGRTSEAMPWLTRATKTCRVLDLPVEHTRAQFLLGTALEAQGDKAGACAAYRVVRERWGKAKPRSVTAEKAAERSKALGCGG